MLQPVFICTYCLPANAYAMPTNTLSFFRFRNVPPATKAGRTAALAHLKHLTWSLNAERRRCAPRHARPCQGIYLLKYLLAEQILIQNYHISLYSNAFNPNVRRRSICAPPNKLWQMFTLSMTSEWECVCTNERSFLRISFTCNRSDIHICSWTTPRYPWLWPSKQTNRCWLRRSSIGV